MILGIDCSRFDLEKPTGVEVYTDRVVEGIIKQADSLGFEEVRLYAKTAEQVEKLLFLTEKWKQGTVQVKLINWPYLWTLGGLSWELLRRKVDVLFVPSHTIPLVVPKQVLWTVHGIEAVTFPQAYSVWQKYYHLFALWWAKRKQVKMIAVSKAVKKDLLDKAAVNGDLLDVIYNGYDDVSQIKDQKPKEKRKHLVEGDFILNVGRLEERKNQLRLIQAFEKIVVDAEYKKLKLVLVGPDGFGAEKIKEYVEKSEWREGIYLTGYQDREMVQDLMRRAKLFAFPSLAEGFGIPILEAFSLELPVMTSKGTAAEEIAGGAAVLCDPLDVDDISEKIKELLKSRKLRKEKIELGISQLEKFGWDKCVEALVQVLKNYSDLK